MNSKLTWIFLAVMLLSLVTWTSAFTAGATKPQTGKRELSSDQETTYRENCAREPILVKENTGEESFAEHFQDQKETESYSTNGEM
ncbi:unnamed protein product, partial [Porites lobata]